MGVPKGTSAPADLAPLFDQPRWQERATISPSSAARLLSCPLKLAFDSEPKAGSRRNSPASALGLVCHAVLNDAARGGLGPAENEQVWRSNFEDAWNTCVRELQPETDVPADHWPSFNARKVASRRLALSVSREVDAGAVLLPEYLLALDQLRGRADLVVRRPEHEIRDYKTGPITDDEGDARPDYVRQLLLYAVMEAAEAGWPEHIVLVPFRGPPLSLSVLGRQPEAEAAATAAIQALQAYNTERERDTDPLSLATPSAAACAYCDHAVRCRPFWESLSRDWAEDGVAAVAGALREARVAQNGGVALELEMVAGSIPGPAVILTPLDPVEFPGVDGLTAGTLIAATGLRPRGDGYAAPGFFTRVAWAQAQ